jgi:hypothetical protein
MTDNNHPITPPQWQVDAWRKQALAMSADVDLVLLEVARWGYEQRGADIEAELQKARDEELEVCCEWLAYELRHKGQSLQWADDLRTARRPKPPSLKEQALEQLKSLEVAFLVSHGGHAITESIRRALESLPD